MEGASGIAWKICCVAFAVGEVFLAGVWLYAWSRAKLMFFAFLSIAYAGFAFISIIVALLAFDGSLGERILGGPAYEQFRTWFFGMQPFVLLLSVFGYIMMARWILAHTSNHAMERTADRHTLHS
jgi:hypothetical protein